MELFEYLEEDKSTCLMTLSDDEHGQCGHSIQEKFPTNLKCHLKTKHQSFRKKRVTRKKKSGRTKGKSTSPPAPVE